MKGCKLYTLVFFLLFSSHFVTPIKCQAKTVYSTVLNKDGANRQNIIIFIDITEKSLYVISCDKIIKKYPIASGKPESPSPLGDFQIIEKGKWGKGFGAAWLGLNVPWGIYGIHGTNRPSSIGRSASHGCIRMFNRHVNELYQIVEVGTPVKIVGGMYGLFGNGFRTLYPGDRGSDVLMVQKTLKDKGYYNGVLDGIYGLGMEKALNKFQKDNNLEITNIIRPGLYKKLGLILFE